MSNNTNELIIVQVAGGLGNQMQQYAMWRKLLHNGRNAKLDLSWFKDPEAQKNVLAKRELELQWFPGLPIIECTPEEKKSLTSGSGLTGKIMRKFNRSRVFEETQMYHPELLEMKSGYLTGYFACEKYYADILGELRELFQFPVCSNAALQEKNDQLIREMEDPAECSVSIHLRRGDYLDAANAGLLGGICTPEYYDGAVRYVQKHEEGTVHYYIFSDDPDYARSLHFGRPEDENTVIDWNTGKDAMMDIRLMSRCQVNICANSTFSFWGARLNSREDKIMIRPSVHKNTQVFVPEEMHDLWRNWILVDKSGSVV